MAQRADVHVQRARFADEVVAPNALQQFVAAHGAGCVLHQLTQQLKFLIGQFQQSPVPCGLAHRKVQLQAAAFQHAALFRRGRGAAAPQQRAHTGAQLQHAERFCHVIVRACIQADDLIVFRILGGQHHYGHARKARVRTHQLQRRNAVHTVQHDVQHRRVRHGILHFSQRVGRIRERAYRIAGRAQRHLQQHADALIILHHKNTRCLRHTDFPPFLTMGSAALQPP